MQSMKHSTFCVPARSSSSLAMGHFFLHLLISVCALYFLVPCFCQETDTISSNSSLRDPNTISSSGQVFQLGYFSPPNTTNRYLGVFYTVSPENIIWVANRDRPLSDSSGSLTVAPDGNLVLTNGWNETLWSTNITGSSLTVTNTSAQLQHTGNLLLRDISTGNIIWESFSQPLNLLVPNMSLNGDTDSRTTLFLSSWRSPFDPAAGNFTFGIESSPLPQLVTRKNGRPYWRSGPWNGIFSGVETMYRPSFLSGEAGLMLEDNGNVNFVVPEGHLMRIILDSTGNIVQAMWNDQGRVWDLIWAAPVHECDIYATCGPFGSCNRLGSPICSCIRGFDPANQEEWSRGNWSGGCVRRSQLQCSLNNTNGTGDLFRLFPSMKVPDFAAQIVPLSVPQECRSLCLRDCNCIAYARDSHIGCMLWKDSLIDVMMMTDDGIDLFIRVSAFEPVSDIDNRRQVNINIIPSVAGGSISVICIISILTAWCWMIKRKGTKGKDGKGQTFPSNLKDETENDIEVLPFFTFQTLADATDQFDRSNLLGTGGFGPVYKGTLQNGKEIAVKRLSAASRQGNEEFMNEVVVISKLQHRNLVRLLGCCAEGEEKMLIYEYMPNKSLDGCLFDTTYVSQHILDWKRRASIIEGIGRGLLYLHSDSRLRIIHRDLKPSNVLLDEDWNPKISDFGMARIFGSDEEHGNTTKVVGTYGYMAPEYAMEGRYSEKSDIYSFGVLMLEILSGRKNTHYCNQELSLNLLGTAWKMWHENNGWAFANKAIASSDVQGDIVRCINIALLCVHEFPHNRPSIETVLSMLSNEIIDLPVPEKPVFLPNPQVAATNRTLNQHGHSVNALTITAISGR